MKKINACLFIAMVILVALFVCLVLVRDRMNRHQYERFEQLTLQKIEHQGSENQRLRIRVNHMEAVVDSLTTRANGYADDSLRWLEQQRYLHTQYMQTLKKLKRTEKQLDESIRSQRIVVPRLEPRTEPEN